MTKTRGIVFSLIIIALFCAIPYALTRIAETKLMSDPCFRSAPENHNKPPTERYFEAQRLLEIAGHFPIFGREARDWAGSAASHCLGNYSQACHQLKYDAEDAAVKKARETCDQNQMANALCYEIEDNARADWITYLDKSKKSQFCSDWKMYLDWLDEIGAKDAIKYCQICSS